MDTTAIWREGGREEERALEGEGGTEGDPDTQPHTLMHAYVVDVY